MVTLEINVLHINKCPFIIAVSNHMKYFQCMGTSNKNTATFLAIIQKMKSDYTIQGFVVKMIYVDGAFQSWKTKLIEQGITLYCCDTNSHVPFIERGIRFVKERNRCVRLMLPKEIKRLPARLMRELVVSAVKMINSRRRKRGVHPVMSPREIVTGKRMVLPSYPPGAYMYSVKGRTTNSIDNMRTFAALYLCPNDERGGYFVYNIATMQRSSACRVIRINKKPIPMTDLIIDTINKQAKEDKQGIESGDINMRTKVNDYKELIKMCCRLCFVVNWSF